MWGSAGVSPSRPCASFRQLPPGVDGSVQRADRNSVLMPTEGPGPPGTGSPSSPQLAWYQLTEQLTAHPAPAHSPPVPSHRAAQSLSSTSSPSSPQPAWYQLTEQLTAHPAPAHRAAHSPPGISSPSSPQPAWYQLTEQPTARPAPAHRAAHIPPGTSSTNCSLSIRPAHVAQYRQPAQGSTHPITHIVSNKTSDSWH